MALVISVASLYVIRLDQLNGTTKVEVKMLSLCDSRYEDRIQNEVQACLNMSTDIPKGPRNLAINRCIARTEEIPCAVVPWNVHYVCVVQWTGCYWTTTSAYPIYTYASDEYDEVYSESLGD